MATTPPVHLPPPHLGTVVTSPIRTPKPPPAPKPKPVTPTPVKVPSATVTRQAVAAQQAAAAPSNPTPKTFQPWARNIANAEQRMRGRLALALADLEHNMATAGQVLDVAEQAAKEAESQILAAAWARWHQDIQAAADASEAILGPAGKAYAQLVARAGADYDHAIATAKSAYEAEIARAHSAAALAGSFPAAAAG